MSNAETEVDAETQTEKVFGWLRVVATCMVVLIPTALANYLVFKTIKGLETNLWLEAVIALAFLAFGVLGPVFITVSLAPKEVIEWSTGRFGEFVDGILHLRFLIIAVYLAVVSINTFVEWRGQIEGLCEMVVYIVAGDKEEPVSSSSETVDDNHDTGFFDVLIPSAEAAAPVRHTTGAQAGLAFLEAAARDALDDLRTNKVASLARPGKLVADVADPDFMVRVMLTELPFECSPFDSHKTHAGQVACMAGLLEKIGRNPGQFHNPAQVEAATYTWIKATYRGSGLPSSVATARKSYSSSFKVVALHLDYNEANLSSKAKSKIKSETWNQRAIEAGYNAHIDHVSQAIEGHGQKWREPGNGLPSKTVTLLRKFIWITDHLGLVRTTS